MGFVRFHIVTISNLILLMPPRHDHIFVFYHSLWRDRLMILRTNSEDILTSWVWWWCNREDTGKSVWRELAGDYGRTSPGLRVSNIYWFGILTSFIRLHIIEIMKEEPWMYFQLPSFNIQCAVCLYYSLTRAMCSVFQTAVDRGKFGHWLNISPFYTSSLHYLPSGGSPFLHRWWFTQTGASLLPPCNSHRKLALQLLKGHNGTCHDDDVGVSQASPFQSIPTTVYNHMGAVIMCSDWNPDPPNILESDEVTFFTLNYIIT